MSFFFCIIISCIIGWSWLYYVLLCDDVLLCWVIPFEQSGPRKPVKQWQCPATHSPLPLQLVEQPSMVSEHTNTIKFTIQLNDSDVLYQFTYLYHKQAFLHPKAQSWCNNLVYIKKKMIKENKEIDKNSSCISSVISHQWVCCTLPPVPSCDHHYRKPGTRCLHQDIPQNLSPAAQTSADSVEECSEFWHSGNPALSAVSHPATSQSQTGEKGHLVTVVICVSDLNCAKRT